jgi:hypothetical protein
MKNLIKIFLFLILLSCSPDDTKESTVIEYDFYHQFVRYNEDYGQDMRWCYYTNKEKIFVGKFDKCPSSIARTK